MYARVCRGKSLSIAPVQHTQWKCSNRKMLRETGALLLLLAGVLCVKFVPTERQNTSLQIKLTNGVVQGRQINDQNGQIAFAFQGIPYASSPVGKLRFRPPAVVNNWRGILDASEDGSPCTQVDRLGPQGSEDCLFINVYTTKKPGLFDEELPIPVMVWIYGGAFISGHSNYSVYGPQYLLRKNVLVVTFNYRVGIFGFLSTSDNASVGNYGLKDQIAALRWVQDNIANFGGDPSNVTIFGESAGAASVSYLMLAPRARGLFHRAISESGTALCPWALNTNPNYVAVAVATALGIITPSSNEMVEALRKVDAVVLHTVATSAAGLNLLTPLNGLIYSPTIEPEHEDAIVTKGSHQLMMEGNFAKVPYIIGFNSEESSVLQEMVVYLRPYLLNFDVLPTNLIPNDMNIPRLSFDYIRAAYGIKQHYFGVLPTTVAKEEYILKFISDVQFVKPIRETARLMSKYTPIYLYQFSYEGDIGMTGVNIDKVFKNEERSVQGVGHSEEIWYLWKNQRFHLRKSEDVAKTDSFTTLWSNFAKFGHPTQDADSQLGNINWPTTSVENNMKYLNIGNELQVLANPKADDMRFWDDLYRTLGRPPYKTY